MKILFYCFGESPIFFTEVIKISKNIDWWAILPTYHFKDEYSELIGADKVFYTQEKLNELMKTQEVDLSELAEYPGSIFSDLAADKENLRRCSKEYQLKNGFMTYKLYKEHISKIRPDCVVFPNIENHDSMILYKTCKELGIEIAVNTHLRNIGRSFFSRTCFGDLPEYAFEGNSSQEHMEMAKNFVANYRKNPSQPYYFEKPLSKSNTKYEESSAEQPSETIPSSKKPFHARGLRWVQCIMHKEEPHNRFDPAPSRRMRPYLGPVMNTLHSLKELAHTKRWDVTTLEQLPKKFIYFPLQVTPEASINTPSPFFVDQLRAVDLIRFNMPSDYYLVVKDHPAMETSGNVRKSSFMQELKRFPGVLLADPALNSLEIVKKTSLTCSITGTACLEAFLLGFPSLHFGHAFFTRWIYQGDYTTLQETIKTAVSSKVDDKDVYDLVARALSASGEYVLHSPNNELLGKREVMNKKNISTFRDTLVSHLEKVSLTKSKSN